MTDDSGFEPTARSYVSQGLALNYLDWGNAGAPTLLLVHGMRDHARSWDWTARALRHDWHVIAVDLRGHGDSAWSPDGAYLNAYHVIDVADLIDTLGDGPVTIVGHSFGSNLCVRYTAMFPQRVRKAVAIEGLGPSPEVLLKWSEIGPVSRMRDFVLQRRHRTGRGPRRLATIDEAIDRMAKSNAKLTPEQARHLAVHGVRANGEGWSWKYDPLVGLFPAEEFGGDTPAIWREVTVPTLLCYGAESWASNPEDDGRAANFPDHRTILFEGAGHWVHHDQFERFICELKAFL